MLEAVLRDNATLATAQTILTGRDFFRDAHRTIYECMVGMSARGALIDAVSLSDELSRAQQLEHVGGPAYIGTLVQATSTYVDGHTYVTEYAKRVADYARLRSLIFNGQRAINRAYALDDSGDVAEELRASVGTLGIAPAESAAARLEFRISDEAERERARREARRRVDQAEFGGSEPPVFRRLDDILRTPIPPIEYVVDQLQPKGSKVLFAAQAKAGKTTTVVNLIRSLVDGVPFLGQFTVQAPPGNVCLLDLEMSESQLPRWFKDMDIRNADRVRVVQLRGKARAFNLLDPSILAQWAADLRRENIGYLIFDNLRPLLDACGLDENHDAGRFLVLFDRLVAEAGVSASMIIHHMGHGADRSRGDSRLRDWPDVEWKLTRQKNERQEVEDPNSPRFFSCYGRDVHLPESQLQYESFSRALTIVGGNRRDALLDDAVAEIYDLLGDTDRGQNEVEGLCAAAGAKFGKSTVREALRHGTSKGTFTCTVGARNSNRYRRGPHPPLRRTAPGLSQRSASDCASPYIGARSRAVDLDPSTAPVSREAGSHVEL